LHAIDAPDAFGLLTHADEDFQDGGYASNRAAHDQRKEKSAMPLIDPVPVLRR
jgi:hypothetical protein